jgi:accessory colonization factor AcfC
MKATISLAFAALLLSSMQGSTAEQALKVYGPGGPQGPMQECAEKFGKERNVKVEVIAGPELKWIEQAQREADVFLGGAEYMLTQFIEKHPDLVNINSRTELYSRSAGILVRKGNPKKIAALSDLAREGVRLVDVNGSGQLGLWEDIAGREGLIDAIQRNIAVTEPTSAEAIEKWKAIPQLDAWITFESWHYRLKDENRACAPARITTPLSRNAYCHSSFVKAFQVGSGVHRMFENRRQP